MTLRSRNLAVIVRDAGATEIEHLASIWHEGWHEAHARIVRTELT